MQSSWNASLTSKGLYQHSQRPLPHESSAVRLLPSTFKTKQMTTVGSHMPKTKQRSEDLVRPESDEEEQNNAMMDIAKMKSGPSQMLGSQQKLLKNRESILDEEDDDSPEHHNHYLQYGKIDDKNDDMMIDIDEGIGEQRAGRLSETYQYNMKHSLQVQQKLSGNYPKPFNLRTSHNVPHMFQKGFSKLQAGAQKLNASQNSKFSSSPSSRLRLTKNDKEWNASSTSMLPKRSTLNTQVASAQRLGLHSTDRTSMLRLNLNNVNLVRSNVRQSVKRMQTVQSLGMSMSYQRQINDDEDALESCRSATNFGPSGHMKRGMTSVEYGRNPDLKKNVTQFGPTKNKSSKQASKNYLSRLEKTSGRRLHETSFGGASAALNSKVRTFNDSKQGAHFAMLSPKLGPLSRKSSNEISPQHGSPEMLQKKLLADNSSANVNSATSDVQSDQQESNRKLNIIQSHRMSPQLQRVAPKRRPATPPTRRKSTKVETPPAPAEFNQVQAEQTQIPIMDTRMSSVSSREKTKLKQSPLKEDEFLSTIKQEYERDSFDQKMSKFILRKDKKVNAATQAIKKVTGKQIGSRSDSPLKSIEGGVPTNAKKGEVSLNLVKQQLDLDSDVMTASAARKSEKKNLTNARSSKKLHNATNKNSEYNSTRSLGVNKSKLGLSDAATRSRKNINEAQNSDKNLLNFFGKQKNESTTNVQVASNQHEHLSTQKSVKKISKKNSTNKAFVTQSNYTSANVSQRTFRNADKINAARKISDAKVIMPPQKYQSRVQEEPMSIKKYTDSSIKSEVKTQGLIQKKKSNVSQREQHELSTNKHQAATRLQRDQLFTVKEIGRSPSATNFQSNKQIPQIDKNVMSIKGSAERSKSRLNSSGGPRSKARLRKEPLADNKHLQKRRSMQRAEQPRKKHQRDRSTNQTAGAKTTSVASPELKMNTRSTEGSVNRYQHAYSQVQDFDQSRKLANLQRKYHANHQIKNRRDSSASSTRKAQANDLNASKGLRKPATQLTSPVARIVSNQRRNTKQYRNGSDTQNNVQQEIVIDPNDRQQSLIYIKLDINNLTTMHNHSYQQVYCQDPSHAHQHGDSHEDEDGLRQPQSIRKRASSLEDERKIERERASPPQPMAKEYLSQNFEVERKPIHKPSKDKMKLTGRQNASQSQSHSRQRLIGQSKEVLAQINHLTSALQIQSHQPIEQQSRRVGYTSSTAQLESVRIPVDSVVRSQRATSQMDQDKYLTVRDSTQTNEIMHYKDRQKRTDKWVADNMIQMDLIQSQIAQVLSQTGNLIKNKRALGRRKTTKTVDDPTEEFHFENHNFLRSQIVDEVNHANDLIDTRVRHNQHLSSIKKSSGTKTAMDRSVDRDNQDQFGNFNRAVSQNTLQKMQPRSARNYKLNTKNAYRSNDQAVPQNNVELPFTINMTLKKQSPVDFKNKPDLHGIQRTNSMQAALTRIANNDLVTKPKFVKNNQALTSGQGNLDFMIARYSSVQQRPDHIVHSRGGMAFDINNNEDTDSGKGYQLSQRETQNSRREKTDRGSSTRRFQDQLRPRNTRHSDPRTYASLE